LASCLRRVREVLAIKPGHPPAEAVNRQVHAMLRQLETLAPPAEAYPAATAPTVRIDTLSGAQRPVTDRAERPAALTTTGRTQAPPDVPAKAAAAHVEAPPARPVTAHGDAPPEQAAPPVTARVEPPGAATGRVDSPSAKVISGRGEPPRDPTYDNAQ